MSYEQERWRKAHDLGGRTAGPVLTQDEHEPAQWERRVDAMMLLLHYREPAGFAADEARRVIETLGQDVYCALSYYERWVYAIATLVVEKGLLTNAEILTRMAELSMRRPRDA